MLSFYAQWYYYVIALKGKTANSLRLEAVPTLRCWRVKGGGRAARLRAAVPAAIVELVPSGRPTEVHECKQQDCKVVILAVEIHQRHSKLMSADTSPGIQFLNL